MQQKKDEEKIWVWQVQISERNPRDLLRRRPGYKLKKVDNENSNFLAKKLNDKAFENNLKSGYIETIKTLPKFLKNKEILVAKTSK